MRRESGGCCGLVLTLIWLYVFVASLIEGRWIWAASLGALMAVLIAIAASSGRRAKGQ